MLNRKVACARRDARHRRSRSPSLRTAQRRSEWLRSTDPSPCPHLLQGLASTDRRHLQRLPTRAPARSDDGAVGVLANLLERRRWPFGDSQRGATASANLYRLSTTASPHDREPCRGPCWLYERLRARPKPRSRAWRRERCRRSQAVVRKAFTRRLPKATGIRSLERCVPIRAKAFGNQSVAADRIGLAVRCKALVRSSGSWPLA